MSIDAGGATGAPYTLRLRSEADKNYLDSSDDDPELSLSLSSDEGELSDDFVVADDFVEYITDSDDDPSQGGRSLASSSSSSQKSQSFRKRAITQILSPSAKEELCGRDKEVEQLLRLIDQPLGGMRPILAGPSGVGKQSIVRRIAQRIQGKGYQGTLKGYSVLEVDCLAIMGRSASSSEISSLGSLLERTLRDCTKKYGGRLLIYFREMNRLMKEASAEAFLASQFMGNSHYICSVNATESDAKTLEVQKAFGDANFVICPVKELGAELVEKVLRQTLSAHPHPKGIKLEKEAIPLVVELAERYLKGRPNPVKAYQLAFEARNYAADHKRKRAGRDDVVQVVASRTNISAKQLSISDWDFINSLEERFKEKIIGQDAAIEQVIARIKLCKMGLNAPKKPLANFLFMGPSGVGKTEMAKIIAELLFDDEEGVLRLDMAEYAGELNLSRLIGAPPGLVGYEQGGQLTEPFKRKKNWVVLLDELEKADPMIINTLLSVFGDARITDGGGETVDCSGGFFIATSNLAAEKLAMNPELTPEVHALLRQKLSPEFCGRLKESVIPFQALRNKDAPAVVEAHFRRLQKRYRQKFQLNWTGKAIKACLSVGIDVHAGHRGLCLNAEAKVTKALQALFDTSRRNPSGRILLDVASGALEANFINDKRSRSNHKDSSASASTSTSIRRLRRSKRQRK